MFLSFFEEKEETLRTERKNMLMFRFVCISHVAVIWFMLKFAVFVKRYAMNGVISSFHVHGIALNDVAQYLDLV